MYLINENISHQRKRIEPRHRTRNVISSKPPVNVSHQPTLKTYLINQNISHQRKRISPTKTYLTNENVPHQPKHISSTKTYLTNENVSHQRKRVSSTSFENVSDQTTLKTYLINQNISHQPKRIEPRHRTRNVISSKPPVTTKLTHLPMLNLNSSSPKT